MGGSHNQGYSNIVRDKRMRVVQKVNEDAQLHNDTMNRAIILFCLYLWWEISP